MIKGKIINVILSGGFGTRLWPISRKSNPKQFLKIFNDFSLFQHTIKRNKLIVDDYFLITNTSQIKEAEKQAKQIGEKNILKIIEPIGRNTAPAITLAALSLKSNDILIVTPSDHMISDLDLYKKSMTRAIELAKKKFIVTFGIKPTEPNVEFGYIEYDKENVTSFREKPTVELAKEFLKQGNFSWNSGIFCFKASVFLKELKKHNNKMFEACLKAHQSINNNLVSLDEMKKIPSDSIDYAVLEKSNIIKTVFSNFNWTDLGTFDAIINYIEKGASVKGVEKIKEKNSFSFSSKKVFTSLDNIIIIETKDSIVVLEKNKTNEIKKIYNKIKLTNPKLIE